MSNSIRALAKGRFDSPTKVITVPVVFNAVPDVPMLVRVGGDMYVCEQTNPLTYRWYDVFDAVEVQ